MQKKNNSKIKICSECGNQEDHQWIEYRSGCSRLVYICCEKVKEKKERINFSFHRYSREPVAFGVDKKTGQPIAIDKRGRRFDPTETRYVQYPDDPHGWKATGKIKPKKTYII